jgi:hypothetical protein
MMNNYNKYCLIYKGCLWDSQCNCINCLDFEKELFRNEKKKDKSGSIKVSNKSKKLSNDELHTN